MQQAIFLESTEGRVEICGLSDPGKVSVTLLPDDDSLFIPRKHCETTLPLNVIQSFLAISFAWLPECLSRYDDPQYLASVLEKQIFAYCRAENFKGKRMLDFGCGSGASTFCLGALLPDTEIIGVELDPQNIKLADEVLAARPLPKVRFLLSPDGNSLPPDLGLFDFVMMSAVYEHLLPEERKRVMPLVWSCLAPGGTLFINQTPYRYFPYEEHSTGLWFINYLPGKAAMFFARHFSRKNAVVNKSNDWNIHLRGGIRGATESQILSKLRDTSQGKPVVLQPLGQDRAAYWLSQTNPGRFRRVKALIASLFRLTDRLWGTIPGVNVDMVIRKQIPSR